MKTKDHFDGIAADYDAEIGAHIRLHLLEKKTDAMLAHLKSRQVWGVTGLDCGCGTGHYIARLADHGFQMSGCEISEGMLLQAKRNNPSAHERLRLGSIMQLPYPNGVFDFCYAINVLHHLPSEGAQIHAINEMLRITRAGGLVFVHDFDGDNPLVRFYMDFIFPLTCRIDDDETEIWVSPKTFRTRGFAQATVRQNDSFTLLPRVATRIGFGLLKAVEAFGERLLQRRFGAHFMVVLEKTKCS